MTAASTCLTCFGGAFGSDGVLRDAFDIAADILSTSACTGMEKATFAMESTAIVRLPLGDVRRPRSLLWALARERRDE